MRGKKMKFSVIKMSALALGLCWGITGSVLAENQWMDSVLPPDHLLENLSWMGDDGKVESKGLFDFEDIRGLGQKDLVLVYRQSVPVNELDKPHNQTFVVCFYDPKQQKYVKSFQDEGGAIRWIKLVKDADKKTPFLILQRDDLNGNQVVKGFAYLNGTMKQVLDATASQVFVKFSSGFQGTQIFCSSKEMPKDKDGAEHTFSWNEAKGRFADEKSSGAAGWSGSSIEAPAAPVVEAKATVADKTTQPVKAVKASHPSATGWWDEPLDTDAAMAKLKTELVPDLLKKNQIAVLGQKAKAFFGELQKEGKKNADINPLRATYYAAVASTLLDMGSKKDAAYYLKTAFSFQADNADALALKAKMK